MLKMIISEKQIMQLMEIASDYQNKIELMIEKEIAQGDAKSVANNIANLLLIIRNQQSEKTKVID